MKIKSPSNTEDMCMRSSIYIDSSCGTYAQRCVTAKTRRIINQRLTILTSRMIPLHTELSELKHVRLELRNILTIHVSPIQTQMFH